MGFLSRAKQGKCLKASAKRLLLGTEGLEPLHFVRSGYWALESVVRKWPFLSEEGITDPLLEDWYAGLNEPEAADRAIRLAAYGAAGFSSLAHNDYRLLDRLEASIEIATDQEASLSELARGLDGDRVTRYWRGTVESLLSAAQAPVPAEGYANLAFIHFWASVVSEGLQASTSLSNQMVSEFGTEKAEAVLKYLAE